MAADGRGRVRRAAWIVFRKEWRDALRDRRTLFTVLLSSVAMGPLVLMLISMLVADMEQRAESREVVVSGLAQAPTLRNYLARQTSVVHEAPADHERLLRDNQLGDPVVVVPPDFEAALAQGRSPTLVIVASSANQRAQAGVGRIANLLQGFNREQAGLRLAVRGVSPAVLEPIKLEDQDLASPAARAAQFTGMLPFFVLMAVVYGALNAALDTTAGERERGSLEPLMMTPASRWALVLGKWGAVAGVGMLIALLSSLSFLPGQWLLKGDALAAMFRYGAPEAAAFLVLLLPLAGALAALLMAVAIRCRTFKEAQASATVVVMAVSLLPLMTLMNQEGERPWHLWVPALAQGTLMARVLKGESIGVLDMTIPAVVSAGLTLLCLVYVARQFSAAASR